MFKSAKIYSAYFCVVKLKDKIRALSTRPGVYQFKDEKGKILYVGKARNLRNRVSSYFTKQPESGRIRMLVKRIADLDTIVVDTELEALLLENNLIKSYQPRYNVNLKDDKSYPWICIKNERFPRVFPTRRKIQDGSEYYGPYASVKVMKTLLELIRKLYPLRTCRYELSEENIEKGKFKVCLEYHLHNCLGPCEGLQSEEDYNQDIDKIRNIVRGHIGAVKDHLRKMMNDHAENMQFEKAQKMKEKIELLDKYRAKSTVVSPRIKNVEVITMVTDSRHGYANRMKVVDGAVVHSHTIELRSKLAESSEELFELALAEFNNTYGKLEGEIIVPHQPETSWPDVSFTVPQRGDKRELLKLSQRNARYFMLDRHRQVKMTDPERHTRRLLDQMKKDLKLSEQPTHIECFDNSNFQGTNAVAACVVFKNLKPSKKDYRHFNIKTVEGPDDYASMKEVVHRRYSRLLREDEPLPQLIVIDGGKGQLSAALESLDILGLRGKVAIVGIAKRLEEIYYPGDSLPLYIDKKSESLKVLQHLRNEAHRFGIEHHRNKRSKSAISSDLTSIPGIGEKTMNDLIREFKSLNRIKDASEDELSRIVGPHKASLIYQHYFTS